MELKEFVTRTILDITNGVYEARRSAPLAIAPGFIEGKLIVEPQMIDFEVAVTTTKEGGGGISIWSVAEAKGKLSSEHINKISFSVPVFFQAENPSKKK
jgi:hypothetical protein